MIRKAKVTDIKSIQKLINYYARRDKMLPRSLNELYENIRDFFVYAEGAKVYGACALHIDWEDLSEIKSLAVAPSAYTKKSLIFSYSSFSDRGSILSRLA